MCRVQWSLRGRTPAFCARRLRRRQERLRDSLIEEIEQIREERWAEDQQKRLELEAEEELTP